MVLIRLICLLGVRPLSSCSWVEVVRVEVEHTIPTITL